MVTYPTQPERLPFPVEDDWEDAFVRACREATVPYLADPWEEDELDESPSQAGPIASSGSADVQANKPSV